MTVAEPPPRGILGKLKPIIPDVALTILLDKSELLSVIEVKLYT